MSTANAPPVSTLNRDTEIKYLLLTEGATYYPSLLRPELERAGLYNWPKVFDGDVELFQRFKGSGATLNKYDVIHVNLAGGDFGLATKVREMIGDDAHAKLVVNMDYSVHYFPKAFKGNPHGLGKFLTDLNAADMVFGVEPKQVALMNYFMEVINLPENLKKANKKFEEEWRHNMPQTEITEWLNMSDFKKAKTQNNKSAALLPHPINVEILSTPMPEGMFAPYDHRGDVLAYQYHRYDGHWEIAKMLMHKLPTPQENGVVLRACLGFTDDVFPTYNMPELVMPFTEWAKYAYFLSTCLWGFEYRTHAAASRFIMECAALGIPVVSTDYSYLGSVMFPDLSFPMEDYDGIREALEHMITDDGFRVQQARHGMKALAPYSFTNAMPRFMMELDKRCL